MYCTRRNTRDLSIYIERAALQMLTQLYVLQLSQLSWHLQITATEWRRWVMSCSSPSVRIKQNCHFMYCFIYRHKPLYLCVFCGSENKQRLFPYTALTAWFVGALKKISKRDYWPHHISLCLSVCPSACNNSAPTGRILTKFDTWEFFEKSVEKIQVSLKSDKNKAHFTWRPVYIYDNISLNCS